MSNDTGSGLVKDVRDLDPKSLSSIGDTKDGGTPSPDQKENEGDADGTDGGDTDAADKADSDGTDGEGDADGTDSSDADGTDHA